MNSGNDKWDTRFLQMARFIASWSKDPSTQVGAVIVRRNRSILSLGFNGFPQAMSDDPDLYKDREKKLSRVVHAEINALIFAREPVNGATLYTWPCSPCDRCCVQLLQAGIDRFVFPPADEALIKRWPGFGLAQQYIQEAGASFTQMTLRDEHDD